MVLGQAACFVLGIGLMLFGCGLGGIMGWFNPEYRPARSSGCANILAVLAIFLGGVFLITVVNW